MGFGAIKVAYEDSYIDQVDGLLRCETVEFEMEGQKKKICFLNPSCLFNNWRSDCAPSLGLRAAHPGADSQAQGGLINFVGNVVNGIKEVEVAARRPGRKPAMRSGDLQATAFARGAAC